MDFENVLSRASQNQGLNSVPQKRYSLQTGPPKKDPKVKGVNSAAVQAFLKKREQDQRRMELLNKKQKEELLARRVELKSDRRARAMASRTKDNFRGYNGIPLVEQPKKRQPKGDRSDTQDDLDEDSYEQSESEAEVQQPPSGPNKPPKKASGPAKPAPPPMNFAELLKLAEEKQFEPVELKATKRSEERLRTADEQRELEMERKVKKTEKGGREREMSRPPDRGRAKETSKVSEGARKLHSSSSRKSLSGTVARNGKSVSSSSEKGPLLSRSSSEKCPLPKGPEKKPRPPQVREKRREEGPSSARPSQGVRPKLLPSSGAPSGSSQVSARPLAPRPSSDQRATACDLSSRRGNPAAVQPGKSLISDARPISALRGSGQGQGRSGQCSSGRGKGDTIRPGSNGREMPGGNGHVRPRTDGPMRMGNNGQIRPAARMWSGVGGAPRLGPASQVRPGSSMPVGPGTGGARPPANGPNRAGAPVPGRPASMGSSPGRPRCTVVAETISTKDLAPRPGMPTLPSGARPTVRTHAGPMLPPITSSYKRKYQEEEEYDSEMEDFIDDEGEGQDVISKHIKEIFGYDRTKYKDESDYALKFMESSWRDQQKEEARSLRLGIKEDEEDMRMEVEEMKKKMTMKTKRKKV